MITSRREIGGGDQSTTSESLSRGCWMEKTIGTDEPTHHQIWKSLHTNRGLQFLGKWVTTVHSVTGKLVNHGQSGQNLRTIVLSSDSEFRIQRKAIREAGCPKSKSKVFQSTWYISITQKREYVARGTIQSGQRREYGHWAARAFTWWRDKNSTRLRAGQVVSISSERRDLNRKSPRNFVHCTAGTQREGDGHGGEEK
ncbi:hypothetical protein EV401DRAFT_1894706 [Pisolithus croceorrhizus]|nr:hypothetical protein EV401DRAFT_1894706 [Pisolithus croceorrhizus]